VILESIQEGLPLSHHRGKRVDAVHDLKIYVASDGIDRVGADIASPASILTSHRPDQTHGEGEAAHRNAFGSLKRSLEKVGDHWEAKDQPGPSDDQDAKRGANALQSATKTASGVNAYATKAHLMEIARRLNVTGRSKLTKAQLVAAIDWANRALSASSKRKTREPNLVHRIVETR
jgi:hypothetical protein